MVQSNKKFKKGFTMVELMVVLAITAILAALVGGGLIGYIRLARFEKNEANARTLFQAAQIALTRMDTAGELDDFRNTVMNNGSHGEHFEGELTNTDSGNTYTQEELNTGIYALYYDKTGEAQGNHNALVQELLGKYIYDDSMFNASICVEIDVKSGQVFSVFYDTNADKLRFEDGAGQTNIIDRSYSHRRNDSLVGYYSAEDRVNVVELQQTQLKVKNPRLSNGETLTLSWSGNSRMSDLDTTYVATAYAKDDSSSSRKPLFEITIERGIADDASDKQSVARLDVVLYNADGTPKGNAVKMGFPLSYSKGNFVLTLDAMADATLLRAAENDQNTARDGLFSMTRLLDTPQDFYIAMVAKPAQDYEETYTASKEETTNTENSLLAENATATGGDLTYFRHLYNLRWADKWGITAEKPATFTLKSQSLNSTGLNWTSGGVTVYCAAGAGKDPVAKTPTAQNPVGWPTIPKLGENITLTSQMTGTPTQVTRVPILNLQINNQSIAKVGRDDNENLRDHYIGLIGENDGTIRNITLRDVDMQVNVEETTPERAGDGLRLSGTTALKARARDDADFRDIRAAGALCGINTGTLENCALTRGTNTSMQSRVQAALYFDNETTAQVPERDEQNTYNKNEPRGIGGLVGVAMPKEGAKMSRLSVAANVTVAGLLVDKSAGTITATNAATGVAAEKARYAAAAMTPGTSGALWRSVGVGGVFGTLNADNFETTTTTAISSAATVTGSGFVGGVAGNLYSKQPVTLTGLTNTGTVYAGASYKGDTAGDNRSAVLGQFFGGIAGYGRNVSLNGCTSTNRSDLTEAQLRDLVKNGYNLDGTLNDNSPLKGDFVGGLVGFGEKVQLTACATGNGYVLGNRFVGGLAGGLTGSDLLQNGTNTSSVFGNRYVGGIVSVNGSGSTISDMTNTGLAAALGKDAAYAGGIVGLNDATWGATDDNNPGRATVQNCVNNMSGDNATDTNRVKLLQALSQRSDGEEMYASYVGGIVGFNGKNGDVTWNDSGKTKLGAILYGNAFVGGVAGYNDVEATIENTSTTALTVTGQVVASGDAVGGFIGMNCAPQLPAVTVTASRVAGVHAVGGVIGANLPVGSFTIANNGAFTASAASGRVEADGVAGGIIGYNRLLASMPANLTDRKELLPSFDENGVLVPGTGTSAATEITFTGFTNELNLVANAYVGGIVGYNDAGTHLKIVSATNGSTNNSSSVGSLSMNTSGSLTNGVSLSALAGTRFTFPAADSTGEENKEDTTRGYLAGGIIGYATQNTTLEGCINHGIVTHRRAAGGLAGWNDGTISGGKMQAALGSPQEGYRYLGGIAGVNAGTITNAFPTASSTVRGEYDIGGVAGVNIGDAAISIIQETPAFAVVATTNAGGVAGSNVGTITASGATLKATVTATTNAGGFAGENTSTSSNTGKITGANGSYAIAAGSVQAANYAGGAAGVNYAEILYIENHATVRATTKFAGGIAGTNKANGHISNSSHTSGTVYATNGMAGGIAGYNEENAQIDNVAVNGNVTAVTGEAGGIAASNSGRIGNAEGNVPGGTVGSGTVIKSDAQSIGAAVTYNNDNGTMYGVTLAENANISFDSRATTVGGLAGQNTGTIAGCTVSEGSLNLKNGLNAGANAITLGGAVGRNTGTVKNTRVELSIKDNLNRIANLGGVAGQNDATLDQCVYKGTLGGKADPNSGVITGGATNVGNTLGGIAGINNKDITSCTVEHITLQAQGVSNVTETQTADQKLSSASHVGGIVGRNAGTVSDSYIAEDYGSLVAARYGFVGGIAGSNNGTIQNSGSEAMFTANGTSDSPMGKLTGWLAQENADGTPLTQKEKYANQNAMVSAIKDGGDASFEDVRGVDTAPENSDAGYSAYSDENLKKNQLTVTLSGSRTSDTDRADGYLGGVTGFNATNGSIVRTATGKWFVYGDNVSTASTVGGAVGQNETAQEMTNVVNCAAVRRFTRVADTPDYNNDNIKGDSRIDTQVGGIVCTQQNRTSDEWKFTGCVNLGNVFNSRSNNIGGIISLWVNYGGRLEYCYNFGTLQTNTSDAQINGGAAGTVGGIAGSLREPVSGGATNIISCGNYGDILWTKAKNGIVYGANDVGGILGKIEMASGDDYMTLNISDCVNGPVTLQAKSMVSGIMGWLGKYEDAPKYVQVNIDRCRNLSYKLQANGTNVKDNADQVYIAGIVGNRGGLGQKTVVASTNITNCFAIYSVSFKQSNVPYYVNREYYSPIAFMQTDEDNVKCINCYYIDRSSLGNGFNDADSFTQAFETMYHVPNSNAKAPFTDRSIETLPRKAKTPNTTNEYGQSLFLGIDKDATDTNNFFAAAMTAKKNAKEDYQNVDGRSTYIDTATKPQSIVRDSDKTSQALLLLWFKDIADADNKLYDANTQKKDGLPGFADITDEAIQQYYLTVLDTEKPQAVSNIQVKASRTIASVGTSTEKDNKVYGRYEVTWDVDENDPHPASYYTVEVLPSDANGEITSETPLLTANVYEARYTFENRNELENQSEYFVVRVTPHNTCTVGQDNSAKSAKATRFMTALPTPQIEVRLVRQYGINNAASDNNNTFAYEQMVVLKNYADYADIDDWTVTVTADKNSAGGEQSDRIDKFVFNAGSHEHRLRNAMGGNGIQQNTTRITAYADVPDTDTKWMRSGQYDVTAFVPSAWMGKVFSWTTENGLAPGKLETSNITFTGTSIEDLAVHATLNFKPDYTTQGNPTYRVMLRAKYAVNDEEHSELYGQYITLAAEERTVGNTDTTFTLSNLPANTLTDYTDWEVIAVPVNSGRGDVVTRWTISEQEAKTAIKTHGADAWWKVGLEIVRKADGTGYDYATLTPLCFISTNTDVQKWYQVTQGKLVKQTMNKTILSAPTLEPLDEDAVKEGNINPVNNQLTYTFTWTQDEPGANTTTADYDVKLYGLVPYQTPEGQQAIGQEEIPLKSGVDLTSKIKKNENKFTLTINVDTDLANGSSSWSYSTVRLLVARVAKEDSNAIGAAATADYNVKQRLPEASVSTISRDNLQLDNADQLLYTVGWTKLDDTRIDHYDLYAVDEGNPATPLANWSTKNNVGELTVDLEQYQDKKLKFYVVARKADGDSTVYDGPNSALSNSVKIVKRAAAPGSSTAAFEPTEPSQSTFLNSLKLNMTLDAAPTGNIYYTGYVFANVDYYNTIKDLAYAWQKITDAGQAKAEAEAALNNALAAMIADGSAKRIIKADQDTVGQIATVSGTTASYILGSEDFKVKPEHAMQYLLPAVRLMSSGGEEISSNWHYILRDADDARLPAIKLDTPNGILSNATVEQTAEMYRSDNYKDNEYVDEGAVKLQRYTVEWSAVNVYQNDDQTLRNLTDSYQFTVTSLDGTAYTITVQTYAKDETVTNENGEKITHKRGDILKVTKTINGIEPHDLTPDENGRYDLSFEPVYGNTEEPTQITGWTSRPTNIRGTVRENNTVQYYSAEVVPTLEVVLSEEGAEPLYRITLPELQTRVDAEDETPLHKVTSTVTLTAQPCTLAGAEDKTTASEPVTVTVNEQSKNQTEGEAFALAVQSAPAELPPVVATEPPAEQPALPPATPETALLAG